jgi:hypothetical protein
VDLGYRGVDAQLGEVELVHRGKRKTLTPVQRRWLKRHLGASKNLAQMPFCKMTMP